MTLLERHDPEGVAAWQALYAHTGQAHRIGVTGPPGVGKSTLVGHLASLYRRDDRTVGVVAVDPTSPLTGGALLGDRLRMSRVLGDPGVFVRSMAAQGHSGGLASATAAVADVLDAAGQDVILIETVGVGQDAVEVVSETHTTVLVGGPGQGDEVQALKAGLLELADILVVNQADRDGADQLAAAWHWAADRGGSAPGSAPGPAPAWQPPILQTVASTGSGMPDLLAAIDRHRAWLQDSGAGPEHTATMAAQRLNRALAAQLLVAARLRAKTSGRWAELVDAVANRHLDPATAAAQLLEEQ